MKIEKILIWSLCSIVFLIVALLIIKNYGPSKPSELQAKEVLQQWFDRTYPETCKIVSLTKVNGKGNSRRYVMYYDATVEILKDTDGFSSKPYGWHIAVLTEGFAGWANGKAPEHSPRKGERFFIKSADISFKKSKGGWVLANM